MSLRAPRTSVFSALMISTALSPVAFGQADDDQTEARQKTVVVTAQRREQNLLEVPISVSAVSGEELEERGVEQLRDLQYAIPGLSVADRGPGLAQIQLRGVSQFVGAPTIGTYLDELSVAPASTGSALAPQLIDIARIEVLRGPQPVLYGESSMGGTIRYITADPVMNTFEGRFGSEIATTDGGAESYRIEGVANLPIATDMLALRLAGSFEEAGGWVDTPREDDANTVTTSHIRGKLLFTPTSKLGISLLGIVQSTEEDESTLSLEDGTLPTPGRAPSSDEFTIFNLVATYDLGFAEVLSSTGYIDRETSSAIDQSGFTVPFLQAPPPFGLGLPPGAVNSAVVFSEGDFERFAQEVRLTSMGEGRLNWIVGANYIDDELSGQSFSVTAPTPVEQLPFDLFAAQSASTSEFWTVYGQLEYGLTERLTASVGARYFEDTRTTVFAPGVEGEETFDSFNPRFALSYDLGDGILYASAAKGFRSGGFNNPFVPPGTPVPPPSFAPEEIWSYEIGAKRSLMGGRLILDGAVYFNDWSEIQQQSLPVNGIPVRFTVNGGEASGYGVDFGAQFEATEYLTISGTAAWNNMEYDTASATAAPGDPLDLVPEWTASGALDYRRPLASGNVAYGRLDVGYTGGSQNTLRSFAGTGFPIFSFVDERTIINAKAGLELDRFDIYVFGENLTDDNGTTYPPIGTVTIPARGRPVTVGLGLGIDF